MYDYIENNDYLWYFVYFFVQSINEYKKIHDGYDDGDLLLWILLFLKLLMQKINGKTYWHDWNRRKKSSYAKTF